MTGTIFAIAGCILTALSRTTRSLSNLVMMKDAMMRSLKKSFVRLKLLFRAVVAACLCFFCCNSYEATASGEAAVLMELDPLDFSSIEPAKVVEECTLALADKEKLKEKQVCRLLFIRGVSQSYLGKYENAIRDLTEALHRNPNDCRILWFRGQIYLSLKQYDEASADFKAIIKHQPKSGIGYACLAQYFAESGDYDSCKQYAEKAIGLDPGEPQGYLARSQVNLKEHKTNKTLKDLNLCIGLSYGNGTTASAIPFQMRAAIFLQLFDNTKKAFADLLMARTLDPNDITTKGMFCGYYFKLGKYNMAFRISEQLVKEHAARPDLIMMRVHCLIERNRPEDAIRLAELTIQEAPRWWGSYLVRGRAFFSKANYKGALNDYNKSLALHPDNIAAMTAKAFLLAACPNSSFRDGPAARSLAIKCCERTDYQVPRRLMLLAITCAECGDFKEAVQWAKKSLEKTDAEFPFLEEYRKRLAQFQRKMPYRFSSDTRVFDYLE